MVVSDSKFVFSCFEKIYFPIGWENLLGYRFSSLIILISGCKRIPFNDNTLKRLVEPCTLILSSKIEKKHEKFQNQEIFSNLNTS